jgi:hypothetical protein
VGEMTACLAEVPIQDGMLEAFTLAATHGADVRVVSDVRSIHTCIECY